MKSSGIRMSTLLICSILAIVLLVTFLIAHYRGKMNALKAQIPQS